MEALLAIFAQLGLDSSVFYQLVIFAVIYFSARLIFLEKLQFVIENRLEKTVHRKDQANLRLRESEKLAEDYRHRVDMAYQEAHQRLIRKKAEHKKIEESSVEQVGKEVDALLAKARQEFLKEYTVKRDEVFRQTEPLSEKLVERISR